MTKLSKERLEEIRTMKNVSLNWGHAGELLAHISALEADLVNSHETLGKLAPVMLERDQLKAGLEANQTLASLRLKDLAGVREERDILASRVERLRAALKNTLPRTPRMNGTDSFTREQKIAHKAIAEDDELAGK